VRGPEGWFAGAADASDADADADASDADADADASDAAADAALCGEYTTPDN
jgi:hypothetical protein